MAEGCGHCTRMRAGCGHSYQDVRRRCVLQHGWQAVRSTERMTGGGVRYIATRMTYLIKKSSHLVSFDLRTNIFVWSFLSYLYKYARVISPIFYPRYIVFCHNCYKDNRRWCTLMQGCLKGLWIAPRMTEGGVHCCKSDRKRCALPQGWKKVVCISARIAEGCLHCCKDDKRRCLFLQVWQKAACIAARMPEGGVRCC